jgi:hypothetical protein
VQVRSYLGTCSQALELVQPSEGPLDDPAHLPEAGSVRGTAAGDLRRDTAGTQQSTVLVVVVAPVGEQPARSPAGPATTTADRWDRLDERHQLGDIVTVPAGQRHRQWVPCRSTITWCLLPVRPRSTGEGPV